MKNKTILTTWWSLKKSNPSRASGSGFCYLRFMFCCFWLLAGLLSVASPARAELKAGDILVIDSLGGTDPLGGMNVRGALILVDPETGQRTELSDFGDPAQGPLGLAPGSVAVDIEGRIFVTDLFAGEPNFDGSALFEVDPETGHRTLLSNFSEGEITGFLFYGLAVDKESRLVANNIVTLVRIDPETDQRTIITDMENPAQGTTEFDWQIGPETNQRIIIIGTENPAQRTTESDWLAQDLALERSGNIIISALNFSSGEVESAIFRVHPATGKRTLLSDLTDPGQGEDVADFWFSTGLAIETSGHILAASGGNPGVAPRNLLLRIDRQTGQRTVLSDFDDPGQGDVGISLHGVAIEASGNILVGAVSVPFVVGVSSIYRVDPETGQRTVLSDSGNLAQGDSIFAPTYIAVVPRGGRPWQ